MFDQIRVNEDFNALVMHIIDGRLTAQHSETREKATYHRKGR